MPPTAQSCADNSITDPRSPAPESGPAARLRMKLRRRTAPCSPASTKPRPDNEQSLLVFCANFNREKLQKIRRRKKQFASCITCKNIDFKAHSTPRKPDIFKVKEIQSKRRDQKELFSSSISPIVTRQGTTERIKRENIVKRNLLEKSLQAVIAEAKKELFVEQHDEYVNMTANNNQTNMKNKYCEFQNYVEDEIFEEMTFRNTDVNIYEPIEFNLYEPVNF